MAIRFSMLLFVTVVLIGGDICVAAAHDSECFLHDVFESFSNQKVKLALTARDVEDVKKILKKMQTQFAKMKRSIQDSQYPVAFFAKNTKNKVVTVGHKLTYDTIVTDTHHTFDKGTGTFTCPKPGVYIFHFNALNSAAEKPANLALYKNGTEVVKAYADDKGNYESSGNTALLQLKRGDKIYVMNAANHPATLYKQYNTFSGHIISC